MKSMSSNLRYFATILVLITTIVFFLFISNKTDVQPNVLAAVFKETVVTKMGNLPVYFEENKGQFNERVRYFIRGTNNYSMFLTTTDAVYVLTNQEPSTKNKEFRNISLETLKDKFDTPKPSKAVAVYMTLAKANQNSEFLGSQTLEHQTNYFKGNDESKWQTNIPNYQSVRKNQIYEGIDMVWHGKENGNVQYDFIVQPNANPNQIEWNIKGAKDVELTEEGDLLIKTEYGDIKQNKPFTYQETNGLQTEIASNFIIEKGIDATIVKFSLGEYDRSKQLTIDPNINLRNLSFSTYLGAGDTDESSGVTVDNNGNVIVTGKTNSPSFPISPGPFDPTYNGGNNDIFLTKLNSTGTSLIYSTFIGGNSYEESNAIEVDGSGNVYITGSAQSTDFPTTLGAYDRTYDGSGDVFVTKLNTTGSALMYSTFIGGGSSEVAYSIDVNSSGNAYLTGGTSSTFPTTIGAFDETPNGNYDGFLTILNNNGSALIYSTYIGGEGREGGNEIKVDGTGSVYVIGSTESTLFPTTLGAFDTTHNGGFDVFVTKLNPAALSTSALIFSTYVGGASQDSGRSLDVDSSGNVYLVGETDNGSTQFPTTSGAFDTTQNGFPDSFATKLNSSGTALVYSTFLGGSSLEYGKSMVIDSSGNLYLTGETRSSDFPVTSNAYSTSINASTAAFLTVLNSTGSSLLYSTFFGGGASNYGKSIARDSSGNIYLTGDTGASNFPTTTGAFDTTFNGGTDVFVAKFSLKSTVPFDYDGDSKTDLSIFRPAPGEWWYLKSSNGGNAALTFGSSSDKLVPSDYTGDGKTDVAFWRSSSGQWFILRSEDLSFYAFPFGTSGDVPVPADYDGDGNADAAVFRESSLTWFIQKSSGGTDIIGFGAAGDKPVVADYDGDGKADIAIYRPNGANGAEWWIRRSSNGSVFALQFGTSTDKPVQGDFTGDGKTDVAFWRPSNGNWFILRSEDFSFYAFPFGANGDVPVAGDYDGDGKFDAGVFRPSNTTWFIQRSTAGTLIQQFGISGDIPTPSAFVP